MLCLSRRVDEKIMIGDDIVVMVLDVKGDRVRIGIDAPSDVIILRNEIYDLIKPASDDNNPRPAA